MAPLEHLAVCFVRGGRGFSSSSSRLLFVPVEGAFLAAAAVSFLGAVVDAFLAAAALGSFLAVVAGVFLFAALDSF